MKQATLLGIAILALASYPLPGATIYDSGPFTSDGGAMESDFSSSTVVSPKQRAEDFILQNASQMTGLNWWGQYAFNNTPQGQDDFTLRIFADAGGGPSSSPLFQFTLGDPGRVDTGIDSFGADVYAYSALLPAPVILDAGTMYWLSIVNNTASDADDNWYWQRVTRFSGTAQERDTDTSPWAPISPSTLAFSIEGTLVPEPSSFILLAAGGTLILLTRRSRFQNTG